MRFVLGVSVLLVVLSMPAALQAQACGNVTYEGCCDGELLKWCEEGQLETLNCATDGGICGWNPDQRFYWCGENGNADPSGVHPKACGGGSAGPVCGNGICEAGENSTNCPQDCVGGCVPSCTGKQCGPDGCGGTCGTCPAGAGVFCDVNGICQGTGACVPNCGGKQCGSDGCEGSCGLCNQGYTCNPAGQCVEQGGCTPDCVGKQCGADGCGGTCGTCAVGHFCNAQGACVDPAQCIPDCEDRNCGADGCGGTCGTCAVGQTCNDDGLCLNAGQPCPAGQELKHGVCVATGAAKKSDDGGCSMTAANSPMPLALGLLLAGLFLFVRRLSLGRIGNR